MTKKYLITSALPYGNGPIHLGHMLEHIQTDIWVKFLRSQINTFTKPNEDIEIVFPDLEKKKKWEKIKKLLKYLFFSFFSIAIILLLIYFTS